MQPSTEKYQSRVLMDWLASRDGAVARAGVEPHPGIQAILPENSVVSDLSADQLSKLLGTMRTTASGAVVTPETSMRVSAVYGCVSLIAGAISTLPLLVYEREMASRKVAEHDYWWMLNEQATDTWTTATALEYFVSARLFYGDAFALLHRANPYSNRVTGWEPLHPSRVWSYWDTDHQLRYHVTDRWGGTKVYDPADILHVPSMGFDGLRSPSPITYAAREAIGIGLSAEEFSARFFSQGSTHEIALKSPKKLNEEQLDALRLSYTAKYGGGKNSRIPLILSGGLDVVPLSMTNTDSALLPTRQFTVEEICRILGVPPFMVGMTDKTTSWGSGVEQMGIGFVKYTLRRHLGPIEQEFNRKLWPNREKYFVEFNTAALERGDFKSRMEGFQFALGVGGSPGVLTQNEVRHELNYEPLKGGDTLNPGITTNAQKTAPAAG